MLASPESRSGALTIVLSAISCNGENRGEPFGSSVASLRIADRVCDCLIYPLQTGFLPLKDITARFPGLEPEHPLKDYS